MCYIIQSYFREVKSIIMNMLTTSVIFQILEKSCSGFLVGSGLTMADIGLMEVLLSVVDFYGNQKLSQYPGLKVIGRFRLKIGM